MTDKPTTPPAGEPTVMSTRQRAEACIDEIIETIDDLYSSAEAETAHQENIAAIESALDAHTATLRAALSGAQSKLAAVQAELDAERGKEAPVDVFFKRMAAGGHSYDAKAGIWWSDDSKPGVLADLEAKLAATEAQLVEARGTIKGCRIALELTPHATDANVVFHTLCEVADATRMHDEKMTYYQRATAAEARVARCHRLLEWSRELLRPDANVATLYAQIDAELSAPPVVPE